MVLLATFTFSICTCVRQKTENSIFRIIDFLLYYQNAFAFWFSVFYARTVFYIYTYSFVLPDICTSHFRVYNSDILYCILGMTGPAFLEEYSGTLLIWCSSIALLYCKNTTTELGSLVVCQYSNCIRYRVSLF